MKKALSFTAILVALFLALSVNCFASDTDTSAELRLCIEEKIAPVVAGVLTGIIALATSLGSISKSLKGLKDTKELFSNESQKQHQSFLKSAEMLSGKANEIKEAVKNVPELEGELNNLKEQMEGLISQCHTLAQILSLGFSASPEIVRSGKGKEMAILLAKAKISGEGNGVNDSEEN